MVTSAIEGLPRQSVGSDMNTRNISSGSWSESFTIMISVVHRVLGLPLASPVENMICTGAVTEMSFADAVPDKIRCAKVLKLMFQMISQKLNQYLMLHWLRG